MKKENLVKKLRKFQTLTGISETKYDDLWKRGSELYFTLICIYLNLTWYWPNILIQADPVDAVRGEGIRGRFKICWGQSNPAERIFRSFDCVGFWSRRGRLKCWKGTLRRRSGERQIKKILSGGLDCPSIEQILPVRPWNPGWSYEDAFIGWTNSRMATTNWPRLV